MIDLDVTADGNREQGVRKRAPKSIDIVVNDAEEMSLEIAQRLLKLNVDAHELEIIRTNTLQKDLAYTSLNADQRRVIDYMCRSLKVEEIEREGRIWRTSFDFFRKLFPHAQSHDEIEAILDSLANTEFKIRNVKTGREEKFKWLNYVSKDPETSTLEIEITARVAEYHRIPTRAEISAYGGYTQYYLTASLGLLLQHQQFFHHILGRRVEWGLKHKQKVTETPVEITVEEMRYLWGLSQDTKPYDLERYWLKDACARMSVATQVRISHYEALRAATRGRPVYAYRLFLTEATKVDFLNRFERFLELAKANQSGPKQFELALNGALDDRAQRLEAIKDKLRTLGAYRGQLQELESLTEPEIVWVEGQLAIWDWAGDTVHKHYKNQAGREVKAIALLWRSIKHRLALQAEYPEAFRAIERQKKKAQVKTDPEPDHSEEENNIAIAQHMAQWFSSLPDDQQQIFMENALREVPEPVEKMYRNGFNRVFRNGQYSPTLWVFKELAEKKGYQTTAAIPE